MHNQDEIEQRYDIEFPAGTTAKEISERLATMGSEYTDEFRVIFCNELLYQASTGYTKYEGLDFNADPLISLFCTNASLLPKEDYFFHAVYAFFKQDQKTCLALIEKAIKKSFGSKDRTQIDEYTVIDWFFEPFKEAFPGFWEKLSNIIDQFPVQTGIPELCMMIGGFYSSKTDDDALDLLIAFHQQYPDLILPKELLGHTYYSKKMWNNSVAYFEAIEEQNLFFRNHHLFFMMAYCYGKTKNYRLEEEYYRKALAEAPDYLDALNNLGYCLYVQKRYVEAKDLFKKCLALDKTYRYAINNYAKALIALGRNKDVKDFIRKGHRVAKDLERKIASLDNTNTKITTPIETTDRVDTQDISDSRIDLGLKRQQFSSEKLLEDELTARIENGTEVFGLKLKMYRRKGIYGRQFIIPIGRLDLLCEDDEGNLYIIELKKDSGYDDAYKQTAEYLNWFETSEYAKGKKIYGIICLNSPDQKLLDSVHNDQRMRVFEYRISYTEL